MPITVVYKDTVVVFKYNDSASSTFYARIFHTKVFWVFFYLLRVWLWTNFRMKNAGVKCWLNWHLATFFQLCAKLQNFKWPQPFILIFLAVKGGQVVYSWLVMQQTKWRMDQRGTGRRVCGRSSGLTYSVRLWSCSTQGNKSIMLLC